MDPKLLNWNVRGLNNPARRRTVHNLVCDLACNIVCLQETKLAAVDKNLVAECLGCNFSDSFIAKDAEGTRGGILIAVAQGFTISLDHLASGSHFITGTVFDQTSNSSWSLTVVYRPQLDADKILFMEELRTCKARVSSDWLLAGDFNLICKVSEKSNDNVNLRMMGRFRKMIDDLELREIALSGRMFTWSNNRENTVHTKIDRVLCTKD